ncbi:MAG TPA: hypothetical protein VF711_06210 [Acidimicrobiales bacterium]
MTSDDEQAATAAGKPPNGSHEPPSGAPSETAEPEIEEAPAGPDTNDEPAVATDEPASLATDEPALEDEEPVSVETPDEAAGARPEEPQFVDSEGEAAEAEPEPPDSRRPTLIGLGVLAVVLVGILIAVVATGGGSGDSPGAASPSTTRPPAAGPTLPPGAFTTFHDDLTGFTIQYPTVWPRAQAPVSEVRFAVSAPRGAAVSVRVNTIEQATTPDNLGNLRSVSNGIIGSNPSAKVLKSDAITLNGLIGYYYLYTFTDSTSGLEGVHAHYFLFQGHKMYSLVFQVLPSDLFASAAGVFDQMAQSFKVDPEPPSTTAP